MAMGDAPMAMGDAPMAMGDAPMAMGDAPMAATDAPTGRWKMASGDFNVYIQIQNDTRTYQLKINKNNTFKDILLRMEVKINKIDGLRDHVFSFDLVGENNDTIKYFMDETDLSLTTQRWNANAISQNETAKKMVAGMTDETKEWKTNAKYINRDNYNLPIIGENSRMTLHKQNNIDRLVFIFKNLTLISNKNEIIDILSKENITMPSELSKFNTQKYTAKQGKIKVINYRDVENIITFSLMFPIYGFTDIRIIELIKKNQQIKSFTKAKLIENLLENIDLLLSIEQTGLDFYMKKKAIHPKYYKLLNVIGLNELFAIDDMLEFSINEINYSIEDIKQINYICMQLIINGAITRDEINDTTDTWKIKVVTRIAKNYNTFFGLNDSIFNKYELKRRFTEQLYKNKLELNTQLNIDFDMLNLSNSSAEKAEYTNNLYETQIDKEKKIEFKKLSEINNKVFAYEQQKNKNPEAIEIAKIETEFASVSLDIVNDITNLFTNPSDERYMNYTIDNIEAGAEGTGTGPGGVDIAKYIFYFKEIVKIITKDGRMFYEGLALLVIAILVFFIESSK
jgi:hypothetical protein